MEPSQSANWMKGNRPAHCADGRHWHSASIAEQLFQARPSRFFPRVGFFFAGPGAPDEFEIFAKVGHMFFRHGIGAAVAALVC